MRVHWRKWRRLSRCTSRSPARGTAWHRSSTGKTVDGVPVARPGSPRATGFNIAEALFVSWLSVGAFVGLRKYPSDCVNTRRCAFFVENFRDDPCTFHFILLSLYILREKKESRIRRVSSVSAFSFCIGSLIRILCLFLSLSRHESNVLVHSRLRIAERTSGQSGDRDLHFSNAIRFNERYPRRSLRYQSAKYRR